MAIPSQSPKTLSLLEDTPSSTLSSVPSPLDPHLPKLEHLHGHPLDSGNYYRLAQQTGLVRQHISRALNGKGRLSLEAAGKIARAASISIDEVEKYIEEKGKQGREEREEKKRKKTEERDKEILKMYDEGRGKKIYVLARRFRLSKEKIMKVIEDSQEKEEGGEE